MEEDTRETPDEVTVEGPPEVATPTAPAAQPARASVPQPPPPPLPPPPPASRPARPDGGRGGAFATARVPAVVTAVVTSLVIMAVLPLSFGNNPVDFYRGKVKDRAARAAEDRQVPVETVERVVEGGQAAVVKATQKLMPAVVNIEVATMIGGAVGSGFIIRDDGYVITNNHVVEGARVIQVSLADGDVVPARVIGTDPDTDLAVIKVDRSGLPVAELGSSADLAVGEVAIAIGSPEGFEQTVTTGIISGLHRNLSGSYYSRPLLDVIQTDAAINPGNSGGPLANISGQVIGINTAIVSSSGGNEGIGFAIPIDTAKPVVEQLIETGRVTHPWLGISGSTLSPEVAARFKLAVDSGALVYRVYAGSPADKAGVQQGDIIVRMDDTRITSMDELMLFVRGHKVGDRVRIELYRGSEQGEVEAVLEAKPSNL